MTPSVALIIATLSCASCSHFHKLFNCETTSPPNEPRRAEHKGSTNHTLQQSVYRNKWFIQGRTIVSHYVGVLTFFLMNKSGFHKLITTWLYLLDRWCLFHATFFHRRWEVWGAPLPSGPRCLPARTNHVSWGKTFAVVHPPSVSREKTCGKLQVLKKKEGKLHWPSAEAAWTSSHVFGAAYRRVSEGAEVGRQQRKRNSLAGHCALKKTSRIRPGWTDLVESWRMTHLVPLGI